MRRLSDVRRDIVGTIRQVVDIVSKYAGSALPGPARDKVRNLILALPKRWANKAGPAAANPANSPVPTAAAIDWCPPEREQRERDRDRGETPTVDAAGSGTGAASRRAGAQRRAAAQRERGPSSVAGPSTPPSRNASPAMSPRVSRSSVAPSGIPINVSHHMATAAAQRILTLATESLDMLRNVTSVMKDSLDRADA